MLKSQQLVNELNFDILIMIPIDYLKMYSGHRLSQPLMFNSEDNLEFLRQNSLTRDSLDGSTIFMKTNVFCHHHNDCQWVTALFLVCLGLWESLTASIEQWEVWSWLNSSSRGLFFLKAANKTRGELCCLWNYWLYARLTFCIIYLKHK